MIWLPLQRLSQREETADGLLGSHKGRLCEDYAAGAFREQGKQQVLFTDLSSQVP